MCRGLAQMVWKTGHLGRCRASRLASRLRKQMRFALIVLALGIAMAQLPIDPRSPPKSRRSKPSIITLIPVRPTLHGQRYRLRRVPVDSMDPYTEPVRTRAGSPLAAEASRQLFGSARDKRATPAHEESARATPTGCSISSGSKPCSPIASRWAPDSPRRDSCGFRSKTLCCSRSTIAPRGQNSDRKASSPTKSGCSSDISRNAVTAAAGHARMNICKSRGTRRSSATSAAAPWRSSSKRLICARSISRTSLAPKHDGTHYAHQGGLQEAAGFPVSIHRGRMRTSRPGCPLPRGLRARRIFPCCRDESAAARIRLQRSQVALDQFRDAARRLAFHARSCGAAFKAECLRRFLRADFYELSARAWPQVLRDWLESAPEKVLFATDAYPFSDEMGWEEAGWVASTTGRQALGLALTE